MRTDIIIIKDDQTSALVSMSTVLPFDTIDLKCKNRNAKSS